MCCSYCSLMQFSTLGGTVNTTDHFCGLWFGVISAKFQLLQVLSSEIQSAEHLVGLFADAAARSGRAECLWQGICRLHVLGIQVVWQCQWRGLDPQQVLSKWCNHVSRKLTLIKCGFQQIWVKIRHLLTCDWSSTDSVCCALSLRVCTHQLHTCYQLFEEVAD